MRDKRLPFVAFGACAAIWGSTFLVIRIGNDTLAPLWAATLRLSLAALILNTTLWVTGKGWPRGTDLRAALGYGVLEFGVSFPLLYWAEGVISSGLAAVVYATCPVTAMLAARVLGMERLSARRLAGALVAIAGVSVVFWREILHGGAAVGLAVAVLAAIAAPIAGLFIEKAPDLSPVASNGVGTVVGAVICLLASVALGEHRVVPVSFAQWWPVVYLAVMGSVGAFVIFAWLVKQWGTSNAAFLGVVTPVIAVVLGALARSESLAPGSAVGAAFVLVGVLLAISGSKRTPTAA